MKTTGLLRGWCSINDHDYSTQSGPDLLIYFLGLPLLTSPPTGTLSQGRPVISSGFTFLNCGRKEWGSQFHGTVREQIPFCPYSLHRNSQCKLLYSVLPPGPMTTILLLA